MPNSIYPKYRQAQLEGTSNVQYLADDIVIVAVDSGYTYDAAHEFLDDVAGGAIVATSDPLTGKTSTDGIADADNVTFVGLTGDPIEALLIVHDSGSSATSRLMVFLDTRSNASGIDITPDGDDVLITWSNGATKIFRL